MPTEMDVDEEVSSADQHNVEKRKSKNPVNNQVEMNFEEHCFNINELLNSNIHVLNTSTELIEERNQILDALKSILSRINDSLKAVSSVSPIFNELIQLLADLLNYRHIDKKIRFDILKILISLNNKGLIKLESRNYVTLVCFLMEHCCINENDKTMTSFVKNLRKLLSNTQSEEVKSACLEGKHKILLCFKSILERIHFCVSDNGVEIVAYVVSIDEEFKKVFHDHVKRILVICKKNEALKFGKIYFRIWDLMKEDDRKDFEERYIQWLMERAFTMGRREVPVRNLAVNLQSLLSGLHQSRKLSKFSKVLTTLYTPLIWKYLNSNNNIHRSNAAEIFMDVYPLEKPGDGIKGYSKYLRKQHEEMLALLDDPCPFVRVIAIKGICANMRYFWVTFQNGTAEKVIEKFVTDLIVDGSYSDVRKAVYQGFTQLLDCEEAHPLLKGVLRSLGGFIHDENQSVRQAFIGMLIKVKEMKCNIKYYDIVDIYNFAVRLADDSPKNRQLIVQLIFSSFINDKVTPEDTYKRLCKFISVNPTASRYLAMYSKCDLPFENAVNIMCLILSVMRNQIKNKMEVSVDENKEPQEYIKPQRKSKVGERVLTSVENISISGKGVVNSSYTSTTSVSTDDSLNRTANIFDPRIAHGLLDFVSMLWLIHGKTLQAEENKDRLEKLYNTVAKCIPFALRFFKGSHAYFGALNLAGMVPLSKIAHCTTVVGSTLSMLRQTTLETPRNENHCMIHVLCVWNRGADVLELVREWLDEAFRSEALNESYNVQDKSRKRRVKFPRSEAKPILALRILDDLFSSPTDQKCVFSRNADDLYSLLNYLSRMEILIERRIEKCCEINKLLSDEFLISCLTLYGNLLIMFNENKVEDFNFWKKFTNYLEWCTRIFNNDCKNIPNMEEEPTDSILFELMQIPLTQCINLIAIGKCSDEQLMSMLEFCQSFLDSEYGIHFVEVSLHLIKQLILFSRIHHVNKRQTDVMISWFPCIIDKILTLITVKIYSKDILLKFIKDLGNFRRNIVYVYILSIKLYPELTHSSPSYRIMRSFCQSLINIVLFPITECETLNVDQNIKNLPFVGSFLASIFMSQIDLGSALLFVLKTIIERFTERDGLLLLATASLLYTLAFSDGKIMKTEILKVVKITHNKIQCLPAEDGQLALVMDHEKTVGDRTIIDVEETTESAVKEIGQHILKKITEHLGGSLS